MGWRVLFRSRLFGSAAAPPLPRAWRQFALAGWIILIAAVIFLSLHPRHGPPGGAGLDKLSHIGAYAALASIPFAALRRRWAIRMAVLAVLALGLVLEAWQAFVPGRDASGLDILANGTGVMLGIFAGPTLTAWAASILSRGFLLGRGRSSDGEN